MANQTSVFAPTPPTVAIELASRRLTVLEVGRGSNGVSVVGYASELLPQDAIVPGLTGVNIANVTAVADTLRRALDRAGIRAGVALGETRRRSAEALYLHLVGTGCGAALSVVRHGEPHERDQVVVGARDRSSQDAPESALTLPVAFGA